MANCDVCGKEAALPFRCRYCGRIFCFEHRLPENHSCKEFTKVKPPERERAPSDVPERRPKWAPPPAEIQYEGGEPGFSRKGPSFGRYFFLRQSSIIILLTIFLVFIGQLIAQATLGFEYYRVGDHDTFLYYLVPSQATVLARPWTLLTSIFLHAGFLHLLLNGIVIFFFGPTLEMRIGRRRFLYIFFGAGTLAAAAQLLIIPPDIVVLGASGAILGVLGALTVLSPRLPVLLFFFIPMPLWTVTVGFGAMSAVLIFLVPGGSIANMAHLTGIVVGLVCGYKLRRDEKKIRHHLIQRFFAPWV